MPPALAGRFITTEPPGKPHSLFSSVQSLSRVQLFATPWTAAHQASLSIIYSQNLLKFMPMDSVLPSNHLILCRPLFPSAFNLSQHKGLFQLVSSLHQVAKYWSFSFSISPSNEYSGPISFRIDIPCYYIQIGSHHLSCCSGTGRASGQRLLSKIYSRCSQPWSSCGCFWHLPSTKAEGTVWKLRPSKGDPAEG